LDIQRIHPEVRKIVKRIPNFPVHNRTVVKFSGFVMNLVTKKRSLIDGVKISNIRLGDASIRLYRPASELSGAALMWIHGGGLIGGNSAMNDQLCADYANDLKAIVVSVGYRLALKAPFPAAIDDCYSAWQWLLAEADTLGVDTSRIVVSGQSAGGGLAANLTHRIHDEGGVQPIAQSLLCPMLDDRTATRRELDAMNHRIVNNSFIRCAWTYYLEQAPGAANTPDYAVAARRKDLSGLPQAWMSIGDVDLFYDEVCEYARRLKDSGVDCHLHVTPMGPHGFENVAPEASITKELFADNFQFLRRVLNQAPSLQAA